jgi:hypothetical protein
MEEEFDWRLPPEMDKPRPQAPTRRFANRRVVVPYEKMPYVDRFTQWRDWHRDLQLHAKPVQALGGCTLSLSPWTLKSTAHSALLPGWQRGQK